MLRERILGILGAAIVVLCVAAAPAAADFGYVGKFGTVGGPPQYSNPIGVALGSGQIYVTDTRYSRVVAFDEPSGIPVRRWGSRGSGSGQFSYPYGIATDSAGSVYVVDGGNNRVQVFTSTGSFIRSIGSGGAGDGKLSSPWGVAVAGDAVYVSDAGNGRIVVFNRDGTFVRNIGSWGAGDGQLMYPYGIAVSPTNGDVYVVDSYNYRVQEFAPSGAFVRKWGASGVGQGQFTYPYGIAVNASGYVFVSDGNGRIEEFNASGTFIAQWGSNGAGQGQLSNPMGLATEATGDVYVADSGNHRIQEFYVSGTFKRAFASAPPDAPGEMVQPTDVGFGNGDVYTVESAANQIQRFHPYGGLVTKWGTQGSGDGQLSGPLAIAVAPSGDVYVTDSMNSRIEEFTADGTFVGKWGSFGTGTGQLYSPRGIAVAASGPAAGHVYVADVGNNRIQEFTPTGTFVRAWGTSGSGDGQFTSLYGVAVGLDGHVYTTDSNRVQEFSFDGGFVRKWGKYGVGNGDFSVPVDVATDTAGNVYVAEYGNHRIQVFSSTGQFLTKWGAQGGADGQFNRPYGLTVDDHGYVYVADYNNDRIQRFGQYPTAPGSPSVDRTVNNGRPTFSWTAASDPNPGDSIEYKLERRAAAGGSWEIAAGDVATTTYTPAPGSPEPEGTWVYRVTAGDGFLSGPGSDVSAEVKVDRTPPPAPAAAADRSPEYAGDGGWFRDAVSVRFSAGTDPPLADGSTSSGTETSSLSDPTQSFDTTGTHTATRTVRDLAGNVSAPGSITVQVDATPPRNAARATVDGQPYAPDAWTNRDVAVDFVCTDEGSGVAGVERSTSTVPDGDQIVTGVCRDRVGHSTGATFGEVCVDKTLPAVRLATRSVRASRTGMVSLRVSIPATERAGASGRLALSTKVKKGRKTKTVALGSAKFTLARGAKATVKVRLPKAGLTMLKKLRRLTATATIGAADKAGNRATVRPKVRLTPAR